MARHTAPAEELRTAAATIRELASNATPGPWTADTTGTVCAESDLVDDMLPEHGPSEIAECYRSTRPAERGDNAAHIALWDPIIAEAVAFVLSSAADVLSGHNTAPPVAEAWLTLARAINEKAAVERYREALARGLSDPEAREEGWPTL